VTTPTLTFIAGANGSGKTTLTRWNSELFGEIPLLDPDAVANTLQATVSEFLPMAAAPHVLKTARKHLEQWRVLRLKLHCQG
jgi:predicted ABC-type ATPase